MICVTGEGSIQMNLQELQTIIHHRFPIKIFVINNGGYHSIRQTQKNFLGILWLVLVQKAGILVFHQWKSWHGHMDILIRKLQIIAG